MTQILARASRGEQSASAALLPLVYDQLRDLAASMFRRHEVRQTLQPTALVHEAYLKLVGARDLEWSSRVHFFAVAAKAMRQILTDHARRRNAAKRGGDQQRITLSGLPTPIADSEVDLIALEHALAKLAAIDSRQSQIVELRFLAGLTIDEAAEVVGVSTATVEREWRMAKAWLRRELSGEGAS